MQHSHLTLMGLLDPGDVVHLSWVGMVILSTIKCQIVFILESYINRIIKPAFILSV